MGNGLRSRRYDTSQLVNEKSEQTSPEFRKTPNWDKDFRENAWNFFPQIINPDRDPEQSAEGAGRSGKSRPGKIEFETREDGLPVMFNVTSDGKAITGGEYAKKLLRTYLGIHNCESDICSPKYVLTMLKPGRPARYTSAHRGHSCERMPRGSLARACFLRT